MPSACCYSGRYVCDTTDKLEGTQVQWSSGLCVQTTSSETAVISLVVIFRNSQSSDFTLVGLMNIENFHSMRAYPRVVNKPSSSYCVGGALV